MKDKHMALGWGGNLFSLLLFTVMLLCPYTQYFIWMGGAQVTDDFTAGIKPGLCWQQ